MAVVELKINGRVYKLSCMEEEKANLEKIGDQLNHMATDIVSSTGVTNENLLLLMLAVLSKDELNQSKETVVTKDKNLEVIFEKISLINKKLAKS